jgi:hypothetical protein
VTDEHERSLIERFNAARNRERARAASTRLSLDLEPKPLDLDGAVANVDRILCASAAGSVDPYAAAINVMGQLISQMTIDQSMSGELYVMWAELTDIVEHCDSSRDGDALDLLRQAAKEWEPALGVVDRSAYFERWKEIRAAWWRTD